MKLSFKIFIIIVIILIIGFIYPSINEYFCLDTCEQTKNQNDSLVIIYGSPHYSQYCYDKCVKFKFKWWFWEWQI